MSIVKIVTDVPGQIGDTPRRVKLVTTDNLTTITTAGYLNPGNLEGFAIYATDVIDVVYSYNTTSKVGTYTVLVVAISNGIITLSSFVPSGDVLLPVVAGDFAVFNGTTGQIKDSGLLPSATTSQLYVATTPGSLTSGNFPTLNDTHGTLNTGKPPSASGQAFVVMSPGTLTSGNIPFLNDANGTLNTGRTPSATTAGYKVVMSPGSLTIGNFPALADTNGTLAAGLPPSASGQAFLVASPGSVTSGHIAKFSDVNGTVADGLLVAANILTSSLTTPDVAADVVSFDVTVGQAALAAGGSVTLLTSSAAKQFKIRSIQMNSGGTNFSGGGGDRLGQITDGTTVYSVIPATNLQTLVNAQWGVTALPNPASAAINTSTAAGASLVFKYSGGTTDYTAGSVVITVVAHRVA